MKVTLISYTRNAAELLIFTKSTRLTMEPALLETIFQWSEERKTEELKYIANTIKSSWEFVDYTFLIEGVSRAMANQLVRTRQASYAQQTLRMLSKEDGYEYVPTSKNVASPAAMAIIERHTADTLAAYNALLAAGQSVENARGVLPLATATNIVAKFNLRTLSEIVKSRSGGRTQEEYQEVVRQMSNATLKVHPWTSDFLFPQGRSYFDDIEAFADDRLSGPDRAALLKIVDKLRAEGVK